VGVFIVPATTILPSLLQRGRVRGSAAKNRAYGERREDLSAIAEGRIELAGRCQQQSRELSEGGGSQPRRPISVRKK